MILDGFNIFEVIWQKPLRSGKKTVLYSGYGECNPKSPSPQGSCHRRANGHQPCSTAESAGSTEGMWFQYAAAQANIRESRYSIPLEIRLSACDFSPPKPSADWIRTKTIYIPGELPFPIDTFVLDEQAESEYRMRQNERDRILASGGKGVMKEILHLEVLAAGTVLYVKNMPYRESFKDVWEIDHFLTMKIGGNELMKIEFSQMRKFAMYAGKNVPKASRVRESLKIFG